MLFFTFSAAQRSKVLMLSQQIHLAQIDSLSEKKAAVLFNQLDYSHLYNHANRHCRFFHVSNLTIEFRFSKRVS